MKGIDAEIHMAKAVSKFSDGDPIEKRELETFHTEFDWTHFMEGYGLIPSWRSKLWILNSPKVLQTIFTCICTLNTEEVVGLFALHFIRFCSFHLRPSIQKAMENLFGSSLLGVKGSAPKSLKYLSAVKEVLPAALCNLYSDEQSKVQNLKDIHSFVKTIQHSTVAILGDSKMFSKKTHNQVIEKIHRMKLLIGKGFENTLPTVVYSPESILNTILRISSETALISLKDLGHPVNRERGLYPCFQVNASYFPEMNEIILPWGILQDPFYKKDAPLGWNYGGLGAVIGHEITHAFDLEGSLYTARAVYKDTWTRRNRDAFKRKTRKVVQFYSRFKHFKHKVDGKKTVSENWADLGGLKISLGALKNEMDSRGIGPEERKKAYQTFFIAYATCWRSLVRKKKMLFSMMTSVHAPAEDRVDRLVPQFQEWVDAFDIQENDRLYLKPSERLHFF
jgi:predicted metalloendopeptidase